MKRAALLLALVAALAACQSPEERVAVHRARAEAYLREGKANEALLELRSALKVDPKNASTCRGIARLYEARGDPQQAYFFYLEASRLDPEHLPTKLEVARLLLGDDPEEAARLTEEVIEKEPENASAWLRLAEIRLVEADADAALAAALTAVELVPDSPNAQHQVGRVHEARYRKARLLSEEEDEEGYQSLLESALAAFDRAAELYSESARGGAENQLERARVLGLLGREAEVKEAFGKAMELAAYPARKRKVLEQALEYGRRNSPEVRRWALEQQIQLQPRAVEAWIEFADQVPGEQPAAGLAVLDGMVEANPTGPAPRIAYARFMARHDRIDDAIAALAEAEADPAVEPKPVLALERAMLLLQKRDAPAARAILERMRRESPEAAETSLLGAQLAMVEGRPRQAIEMLRASLESAGARLPTRRMLAESYYAAGERARASAEINEILAVAPRDPEMLSLKARIQLEQGMPLDAIRTLRALRQQRSLNTPELVWLADANYRSNRPGRGRAILARQLARWETPSVVVAFAEHELERRPARVRQLLQTVWERKPGLPRQRQKVLELLTALDLKQKKYQDALGRIDELFEAGWVTPEALLLRAKVFLAMGRAGAGERDLLGLLGRGVTDPEAVDLLVRLYTAQGRAREAIASFEEASKAGVLPPETLVLLARLYWSEGEFERARDLLDAALEKRSDLPHAKNDLAYLLAERGEDLERALRLAQEARSALPGDPNTADTLGWVYLRRGLAEPAIEQFREAIGTSERSSNAAIFHHHLGMALRDVGRLEDARQAFETALAADPEFSEKDAALAALQAIQQSSG